MSDSVSIEGIVPILPTPFLENDEVDVRHLADLVDFARSVCDAVSLPVVVQDWNPSGPTVGLPFALELRRHCGNFRYLKLEKPKIGPLIRALQSELAGTVKVFGGWGGLYAIEFQASGACGLMPGLALADIFVRIWNLGKKQAWDAALALFAHIAPYLQFSLQTFEQFHHAEKRLLLARGLLGNASVRPVTVELDDDAQRYLSRLFAHLATCLKAP